jgi:hypothetical protein
MLEIFIVLKVYFIVNLWLEIQLRIDWQINAELW